MFVIRRLFLIVFIIFAIITMSYGMIKLSGASALSSERGISDKKMAEEERRLYEEQHNYVKYMTDIMQGNFGKNSHNEPINEIILPAIPVSFSFGFVAIIVSLVIGVTAGIIGAFYQNAWPDRLSMFIALVGLSIPAFVLGPLFQKYFGIKLQLLPVAQWWQPFGEYEQGSILNIILPVLTIASIPAATIARLTRSSMLEALSQDYIRTALAKGLSRFNAATYHGLKNACLPVLSYLGPAAASILMGSIIVEKIFRIPGLGTLMIDGATDREVEVVLGVIILYSLLLLVFNLVVDILYRVIDPRIKEQ